MLDQVALAYGGFDSICVTAGIFVPSDTTGHIPDDKWAVTFNINVTGSYLVGDEAAKTWKEQGLRGKLVLTTSARMRWSPRKAVSPTTRPRRLRITWCASWPSSLRRWCASMAWRRRQWCKGSAMFPRDRVIGSLAKYKIPYTEDEETESLVNKLAQFYADRTLTQVADYPRRSSGSIFSAGKRSSEQDDRSGHYRRRRIARGVPALIGNSGLACTRPISKNRT